MKQSIYMHTMYGYIVQTKVSVKLQINLTLKLKLFLYINESPWYSKLFKG